MNQFFENKLGEILWLVNANKPNKNDYYPLKDKILKLFGKRNGFDLQHIKKECYTCHGTGWYTKTERCYNCTNGIYNEFYCVLDRYILGERVFHLPLKRYSKWQMQQTIFEEPVKNNIEGYIRNDLSVPYETSKKYFLLLCLIFNVKKFLEYTIGNFLYWNITLKINKIRNSIYVFFHRMK